MDDKKLLDKLSEAGFLSAKMADKLLEEAKVARNSVEDSIYDRRLVSEEDVAKVKSELLQIPYKKVDASEISDETLKLLPEETVMNYKVVPLGKEKGVLTVGMIHPEDQRSQEALRFYPRCPARKENAPGSGCGRPGRE